MITLTIRHSDQPLAQQITRLYKAFSRLRSRKLWTDAVHGGVAVLEVHHNGGAHGWHPHLHVICECGYIPRRELAADWHAITRDSYVVHIAPINRGVGAARYVVKYLSKPMGKNVLERPGYLTEAIDAMHGRKQIIQFGTWKGEDFTSEPDDDDEWEFVGDLYAIIEAAERGDSASRAILRAIRAHDQPLDRGPPPGPVDPFTLDPHDITRIYS